MMRLSITAFRYAKKPRLCGKRSSAAGRASDIHVNKICKHANICRSFISQPLRPYHGAAAPCGDPPITGVAFMMSLG